MSIFDEAAREQERAKELHGDRYISALPEFAGTDGERVMQDCVGGALYWARHTCCSAQPSKAAVLLEEVCEALLEQDPVKRREELVQVTAMAGQWAADIGGEEPDDIAAGDAS